MATIIKAKGGNKTLNPHARDEFNKGKKIGRPKQVWVWDVLPVERVVDDLTIVTVVRGIGHWEKA